MIQYLFITIYLISIILIILKLKINKVNAKVKKHLNSTRGESHES